VAFSDGGPIGHLDPEIEDALLQSRIDTIYFCDEPATSWLAIPLKREQRLDGEIPDNCRKLIRSMRGQTTR
jgi:hypothetical protein